MENLARLPNGLLSHSWFLWVVLRYSWTLIAITQVGSWEVCAFTDIYWTHLLIGVGAVVCIDRISLAVLSLFLFLGLGIFAATVTQWLQHVPLVVFALAFLPTEELRRPWRSADYKAMATVIVRTWSLTFSWWPSPHSPAANLTPSTIRQSSRNTWWLLARSVVVVASLLSFHCFSLPPSRSWDWELQRHDLFLKCNLGRGSIEFGLIFKKKLF